MRRAQPWRTAQRHPAATTHVVAWVLIALAMFFQPVGEIAADTKLDLHVDPAGFLAGALSAYTPNFPLGQLQNQAYGYLFPQGAFFLLTDFLPDWVAQRLWWTIVVGVGFSGFLLLTQRIDVGSHPFRIIAAALYAFSPRTLTTLTAISSETWPTMLAPWVLWAVLSPRLDVRALAAAIVPVALMGAVNATATAFACLPAAIALLWRIARPCAEASRGRAAGFALAWLAGCALVSLWWIGPLLVLGRYAPPFTDFIESAFVTNRWLNLGEILRGTTSWSPFADAERRAGLLLVSEPVLVLVTMAIAAAGLAGLCRRRLPARGLWLVLLAAGVAILGAAHGPAAGAWLEFLDTSGAPLRNLHKADPLVRLPLMVGLAHLGTHLALPATRAALGQPGRRHAGAVMVVLVGLAAISPVFSGRLLPLGTWSQTPQHWVEATAHLNEHAAGTRSLIVPQASFARQEWGWTRDEPAQPLLDVPWAVRDAIPLVTPEAIRGLDGVMSVLEDHPERAGDVLPALGIGAVLVRHDLDDDHVAGADIDAEALAEAPGSEVARFGDGQLEIITFAADRRGFLTEAAPVTVAGGGESVAVLDALTGFRPRELVAEDAEIVTDTPMLATRNYGTVDEAISAPLADRAEGADVRNHVPDYPSTSPRTAVVEHGGAVRASSSAAQATSLGGADPARSVTAAVDGSEQTAWWPAPGETAGEWIELSGDFTGQERVRITANQDAELVASTAPLADDPPRTTLDIPAGESREVVVPGPATGTIRLTIASDNPVGLQEIEVEGHDIERVVTVPDTSPNVRMFVLQRLIVDTGVLIRDITAPREMTVTVDADTDVTIDGETYSPGDELTLAPGTHRVESEAEWVTLTEPGFAPAPATERLTGRHIEASDTERIVFPGLSANEGLRARIDDHPLTPTTIGAGMQGFVVPAGVGGELQLSFAGDYAYRGALFIGGGIGILVLLACLGVLGIRVTTTRRFTYGLHDQAPGLGTAAVLAGGIVVATGWPGALAIALVALVRRFTLLPAYALAAVLTGVGGAWLARAPWPSPNYAGDETILAVVLAAALACALPGLLPSARDGSPGRHRRER
ncbi:alpha-(1-_3)-arabinofuranosyltransferase family protein [Corynebacterium yudongzhengii]|nr:alpha-(1->3)-arabinofuranosyltransferase family protein [Corynebacterium yudongzhengii]